jgi:hypothetical protein
MTTGDIHTHTEHIHQDTPTSYKFQTDFKQFIMLLPAPLGPRTTILMPLVITKLQSLKIDGGASSVEASSPSSNNLNVMHEILGREDISMKQNDVYNIESIQ